jgi:hypothetical protein
MLIIFKSSGTIIKHYNSEYSYNEIKNLIVYIIGDLFEKALAK